MTVQILLVVYGMCEKNISSRREKLRFYEKKVLEAESERIEKEKENLELKESLMRLQAQLKAREKELMKGGGKTKFEAPNLVFWAVAFCQGMKKKSRSKK